MKGKRNKPRWRQIAGRRTLGSAKNKHDERSRTSVRISGTNPPSLVFLPCVLLGLFMSPLMAIGGSLINWAIEGSRQPGQIWLGLLQVVFGISFIGLWFYVIWKQSIWEPSITITRFELIDRSLKLQIPRMGEIELRLDDVIKCYPQHSKVGITGWWIRLKNQPWIYLHNDHGKAKELAAHILNREAG